MSAHLKEQYQLIGELGDMLTDSRRERIESVAAQRTRYLTLAIEDLFQPHNTSAVLRSCDCYGIQEVHIIEERNEFSLSREIAMGSSNWLDIHRYNEGVDNTATCIDALRSRGYRIVATSPHSEAHTPLDIPLDQPLALFFGTEKDGLKPSTLQAADLHLRIPMFGFTESFNISVSAAICLSHLRHRLEKESESFLMEESDKNQLVIDWMSGDIRGGEAYVKQFWSDRL